MDYIKNKIRRLFMSIEEEEAMEYENLLETFSKYYPPGADPDQEYVRMFRVINSMADKREDETILQYVRRVNFLQIYNHRLIRWRKSPKKRGSGFYEL
jgi:hypothetical protein